MFDEFISDNTFPRFICGKVLINNFIIKKLKTIIFYIMLTVAS